MTQNQLTYWRDQETQRSNRATEYHNTMVRYETTKHNREMERLEQQKRNIEKYNAQTNRYSAQVQNNQVNYNYTVQSGNLRETIRSNQYNELLKRQEMLLKQRSNTLDRMTLLEQQRRNTLQNSLALSTLAEQARANMAREAETTRSNRASESLQARKNAIATQTLQETKMHNRRSEGIMEMGNRYQLAGSIVGSLARVATMNRRISNNGK